MGVAVAVTATPTTLSAPANGGYAGVYLSDGAFIFYS